MRKLLTVCLPISASCLTVPLWAHQPVAAKAVRLSSTAETLAVTAAVEAFHRLLKEGKAGAAAALLADNALIYESGNVEYDKADYVEHHLPADVEFSQATIRTVTRSCVEAAGRMAWIATELRITGVFKGRPINILSTETMVLRRFGKDWKITHIHWSSRR